MMNNKFLPYGHQIIDEDDINSVVSIMRGEWLTTGPSVEQFENDVCNYVGAKFGVAVSSGTAALHMAMSALNIGPGDEVIVPAITFVASANCVLYQGGKPIFADIDENTLLIDTKHVETLITSKTKAIIAVDYAGQPCNWSKLRSIADRYHVALVADSCHALGAKYQNRNVGTLADITVFSFHPVKHITTGEGGMAVTNDEALANHMRAFRGHGITTTAKQRENAGAWFYEMIQLGYNYRITDLQCALGSSQIKHLKQWLTIRNKLAEKYDNIFLNYSSVKPLQKEPDIYHAYHLYVVMVDNRNICFNKMRQANIGVNVHYIPVYLHPYYQSIGYRKGLCPRAEDAYKKILTIPLWAGMSDSDAEFVAECLINGVAR